ncbi:carbohydrate binding domain-containing protein [bacterium]|nr:carbohydrate binding domain-containing protein [bacterium]
MYRRIIGIVGFCFLLLISLVEINVFAGEENLIKNSDVELGKTGWSFHNPSKKKAEFNISEGIAHSGKYSLHMIGKDEGYHGGWAQKLEVLPETEYFYSAWIKIKPEENFEVELLYFQFGAKDGKGLGSGAKKGWRKRTTESDWEYYEFVFTTPAETAYVYPHPVLVKGKGEIWIDDIVLKVKTEAEVKRKIEDKKQEVFKKDETYAKEIILQGEETNVVERHEKVWKFEPINTDKRVLVEFIMRINHPKTIGWNPYAAIYVNGVQLDYLADRKNKRLINKDFDVIHSYWGKMQWQSSNRRWHIVFSPDYKEALDDFEINKEDVFKYVFDISDLVSSNTENKVAIRAIGSLKGKFINEGFEPDLMVKSIRILVDKEEISSLKKKEKTAQKTYITMKDIPDPEFKIIIDKNGLIKLIGDKFSFPVESFFSIPESKWCSFSTEDAKNWEVTVKKDSHKEYTITAENKYYTLERKVFIKKQRVDVFDKLKNTTSSLVGIKIRHEIDTENLEKNKIDEIYLAGDSCPTVREKKTGRNPSTFLADYKNNKGIGIIANDDVFRIQNIQYYNKERTGIKTDNFALSPGKTYTLEWAIYPVMSSDYFDFINTVRIDWNVNFTIDGGLCTGLNMAYMSENKEAWAHQTLTNMALKYRILASWYNSWLNPKLKGSQVTGHHGSSAMEDEQKDLQEFAKEVFTASKKYAPSLKRLQYLHVQITAEKNAEEKYKDSLLVDEKENHLYYSHKKYQLFVPTLENSYGKKLFELVNWYFDNFDIDGIYNDEICYSKTPITYNMWDGYSVVMDEDTHKVKRKIGFVNLVKLPFHTKLFNYILKEKKKILIGNFAPESRTMTNIHFTRFEETWDHSWAYYLHLYTPVTLGDMLEFSPDECAKDIREVLKRGNLYYYYHLSTPYPTITTYMFPFTPVQIHSGWMLGEERILTVYSGDYGWTGEDVLAEVHVYDETGREAKDTSYTLFTSKGTRIRLNLKEDYMAAVVKLPIKIETAHKGIEISEIKYKSDKFSFKLKGEGRVDFVCNDKVLKDGDEYVLLPDNKVIHIKDGKLIFTIDVQGEKRLTVERR